MDFPLTELGLAGTAILACASIVKVFLDHLRSERQAVQADRQAQREADASARAAEREALQVLANNCHASQAAAVLAMRENTAVLGNVRVALEKVVSASQSLERTVERALDNAEASR